MNLEVIYAIWNCAELTIYEKSCLTVMCTHSKRPHYDPNNHVIMDISISNTSLMQKIGCGKTTFYDAARSLREKGILINTKETEWSTNSYIIILRKLKTFSININFTGV